MSHSNPPTHSPSIRKCLTLFVVLVLAPLAAGADPGHYYGGRAYSQGEGSTGNVKSMEMS